ncbi:MAG: hypothetical protein KJ674_01420 [Nanoarchaeota archaeon]|nr:hypothetical protein [Nanoarchaeota archaeon]
MGSVGIRSILMFGRWTEGIGIALLSTSIVLTKLQQITFNDYWYFFIGGIILLIIGGYIELKLRGSN